MFSDHVSLNQTVFAKVYITDQLWLLPRGEVTFGGFHDGGLTEVNGCAINEIRKDRVLSQRVLLVRWLNY